MIADAETMLPDRLETDPVHPSCIPAKMRKSEGAPACGQLEFAAPGSVMVLLLSAGTRTLI
jgi:hypothetical protein